MRDLKGRTCVVVENGGVIHRVRSFKTVYEAHSRNRTTKRCVMTGCMSHVSRAALHHQVRRLIPCKSCAITLGCDYFVDVFDEETAYNFITSGQLAPLERLCLTKPSDTRKIPVETCADSVTFSEGKIVTKSKPVVSRPSRELPVVCDPDSRRWHILRNDKADSFFGKPICSVCMGTAAALRHRPTGVADQADIVSNLCGYCVYLAIRNKSMSADENLIGLCSEQAGYGLLESIHLGAPASPRKAPQTSEDTAETPKKTNTLSEQQRKLRDELVVAASVSLGVYFLPHPYGGNRTTASRTAEGIVEFANEVAKRL